MLKQSKIILKSLTSFHWHPYRSRFIRSLRNVRLDKIFERTYQDSTGVGLVDKDQITFKQPSSTVNSPPGPQPMAPQVHLVTTTFQQPPQQPQQQQYNRQNQNQGYHSCSLHPQYQ